LFQNITTIPRITIKIPITIKYLPMLSKLDISLRLFKMIFYPTIIADNCNPIRFIIAIWIDIGIYGTLLYLRKGIV
jgi:hypothetical protein